MNLMLISASLSTLSLLAMAFLIQRIRSREAAEARAAQELTREKLETSARLANVTHELITQFKEQAKKASVATLDEISTIEANSMALLAQATSMGVQAWQAIIPAFVAAQGAMETRRQQHRLETSAESDRHAAEIRANGFEKFLAKVDSELRSLDHCASSEESLALQTRVRWLLSLWGIPSEQELQALVLSDQDCVKLVHARIQVLRNEAIELGDRKVGDALRTLEFEGRHADIVDFYLNRWHHEQTSPNLFGAYHAAVTTAIQAMPPEEATRILVELENHLRTFKTTTRLEDFHSALEFQANLQNTKQELQGRIRIQRQAAFLEIVASLLKLSKQSQAIQSRGELSVIKQEADKLADGWGLMNPAERAAWDAEYGPFMKVLLDRDETLLNAERALSQDMAKISAIQVADQLGTALTKASNAADLAKDAKDLDQVLSGIGKVTQPNMDALPKDKSESLEVLTQKLQSAVQAAEQRIIAKMRAAYNQHSVNEIDSLLGRLGQAGNQKTAKANTLAGGFAGIDPALLDPAIHQYYELAVGKVVNLLGDEATRAFMHHLASAPKAGLEAIHG